MATDRVGIYKMAKNVALLIWRAIDPVYLALMPELSWLVVYRRWTSVSRLVRKSSISLILVAFYSGTGRLSDCGIGLGRVIFGVGFDDVPQCYYACSSGS